MYMYCIRGSTNDTSIAASAVEHAWRRPSSVAALRLPSIQRSSHAPRMPAGAHAACPADPRKSEIDVSGEHPQGC